jgi:hypothetical protein
MSTDSDAHFPSNCNIATTWIYMRETAYYDCYLNLNCADLFSVIVVYMTAEVKKYSAII